MSVLPAWPLTIAELARHLGVNRATVHRALATAHDLHATDPTTHPAPPRPANPGERPARYHGPEFVAWWPTRARRPQGRPATTGTAPEPEASVSPDTDGDIYEFAARLDSAGTGVLHRLTCHAVPLSHPSWYAFDRQEAQRRIREGQLRPCQLCAKDLNVTG